MDLPFELHIALRYLLAKRKLAPISVVSLFSTVGVAVGVMAVIIALAMMTGLQQELRDRILGSSPHIYVWKTTGIDDARAEADKLRQIPHVVGAAPAIIGQGLLTAAQETMPVQIKGIEPVLEQQVTDLRQAMRSGSIEALTPSADGKPDGILLGTDLAAKLNVKVGDDVSLLTPNGTLSPMGMLARNRRMRVAGIFSLGLFEFDSTYGYVSIDVAKRVLGKDRVDHIQLRVDDIMRAPQIADSIPARLGDKYIKQDWADMQKSLFSALLLEKIAVSLAIGLIVVVAALNIVSSLILLVMRQERDGHLRHGGPDHRDGRHHRGCDPRIHPVHGTRPLQADSRADGRVPGLPSAIHGPAARFRIRGGGGRHCLFSRHDLSVPPSRPARPGAGLEVRMRSIGTRPPATVG